ncbi:CocE/NonD family hydrolase [Prosthecobacter sp. SYSU 5D2]|uniref:CocE/NonD family hydrolase n=1 Tax=Prosthecobacter sp. SYSU 5D2 TaxID=3134134 RepID=UPI0031FEB0B0
MVSARDLAVEVTRNVAVPMRDGVVLRADVFRPATGGPYPVLVMRTPYGKQGKKFDAYVKAGYIVVCQDARGRYESEGEYESFYRFDTHDAEDGYDTVEWAARLPGSNGKTGTFGASYNAFLQWRLAPLRPPSLVAMAASSIPPRLTQLEGPGTIRPGRRLSWFYAGMSPDMRKRSGAPGPVTKAEAQKLWKSGEEKRLMQFLPWLDLPDSVFEGEAAAVKHWLRNPHLDPCALLDGCPQVAVPNLDIIGWFDHCNDSIELDQALMQHGSTAAARQTRLIIGPWSHSGRGKRKQGTVDFGPAAVLNLAAEEIRWFDRWLKGKTADASPAPPVRIFIMGANQWRDENEWPLSRAVPHTFYLGGKGSANTPAGGGQLSQEPSAVGTNSYTYDPRDPVPTLWTPAMFTVPAEQAPLAERQDILVYQSQPLTAPLEVTGYPQVILHAASTAPDTDFFARLIDVAPDGSTRDITMGMVRARYRNGLADPRLLTPGEVTEYKITLRPTANQFQKGHRIRLDITSSDFPNYDRNHNTAADPNSNARLENAEQTVHHGGIRSSRIILPVIP